MVLWVLPVAAAGALVSARSPSLGLITAGCALQGVAGALTPLTLGIVRESLPSTRVPFGVGLIMASLVAGGGLSFMVAGLVVDHFSWTGGFYLKVALAIPAFMLMRSFVPDRRPPPPGAPVNVLVGTMFAVPIAMAFAAAGFAHSRGLADPLVIGLLLAAAFSMVAWARHQTRAVVPLIDLRLLARRQVFIANLCLAFLCLGCMQNGQVLSLFLQQPIVSGAGFGLSATLSGLALMALLSVAFVAGPAAGSLISRYSGRVVATAGFMIGALGWALNAVSHENLGAFLLACTLGSVCVVGVQTAAYSLMIAASPEERTSEVVGLANIVVSVFMGAGAQVVALLLARSTVEFGGGNLPGNGAYATTFAYIAVMSLLGILVALAAPRATRVNRS
jgi:hypothetical protein